jgi:2-desacetyl-2-hydroxyethyl bacteriochlorophyllide A dehydrogenase
LNLTKVVIAQPGHIELRREPVPDLTDNQILVRTRISLISSGTEKVCYGGDFQIPSHWASWITYPFTPGYSLIGEVTACGPRVTRFRIGDRVATRRPHQSHIVVSENSAYPVPDAISDEDAAWFAVSAIAQHAVRTTGIPVFADTVAVAGLGPIGQLITQYALVAGARELIAIATNTFRLAAAQRRGATHLIPATAQAAAPLVRDATAGHGAGISYDATGDPQALAALSALTRTAGTIVLVGDTAWPDAQALGGEVLRKALTVRGVHDSDIERAPVSTHHRATYAENVAFFFRLIEQHRIIVDDLTTHVIPMTRASEAFDLLTAKDGNAIGVVLDWRSDDV